MKLTTRSLTTLILTTCATGLLLAQATPMMNVKLGLWEMTVTIEGMDKMMPDLSKMTPEQRAQVETMMRGRGIGGPMITKVCMTKEKMESHKFSPDREGQKCTEKVSKNTATVLDVTETCTGDQPGMDSTSEMHVVANSTTSVTITAKSSSGDRKGQPPMAATMSGKWTSADCGDVK